MFVSLDCNDYWSLNMFTPVLQYHSLHHYQTWISAYCYHIKHIDCNTCKTTVKGYQSKIKMD